MIKKIFFYFFLIALLFNDSFEKMGINYFNYLDEILVLLLTIKVLSKIHVKYDKNDLFMTILLITYLFSGVLSFFINSYGNISSMRMVISSLLVTKFYILIIVFKKLPISKETEKEIKNIVLNIAYISSIFVLISFLFPNFYMNLVPFINYETPRFGLYGGMGLFYFSGISGWFYLFISLYFLSEFENLREKKSIFKMIYFTIIATLSIKVKVIVTFLVVICYWAIFINKKNKTMIVCLSSFIISMVYFTFYPIINKSIDYYLTNNSGGSDSARFALLSNSINILKDKFPLGVGFSQYGSYFAQINYSKYYFLLGLNKIWGLRPEEGAGYATDTYWPQVFGETGVLGTMAIFIFLIHIYYLLKKNVKINREISSKINSLFAIFILIQVVIESVGGPIFTTSPQFIFVSYIIGSNLKMKGKEYENLDDFKPLSQ